MVNDKIEIWEQPNSSDLKPLCQQVSGLNRSRNVSPVQVGEKYVFHENNL